MRVPCLWRGGTPGACREVMDTSSNEYAVGDHLAWSEPRGAWNSQPRRGVVVEVSPKGTLHVCIDDKVVQFRRGRYGGYAPIFHKLSAHEIALEAWHAERPQALGMFDVAAVFDSYGRRVFGEYAVVGCERYRRAVTGPDGPANIARMKAELDAILAWAQSRPADVSTNDTLTMEGEP